MLLDVLEWFVTLRFGVDGMEWFVTLRFVVDVIWFVTLKTEDGF